MNNIRQVIAKNIKMYRNKANMTQKQLAEKLNVKNSAVSNWENGTNSIDIERLMKICDIFNVSINDMYGVKSSNINETLTKDEKELLDLYRKASEKGQGMAIGVLMSTQNEEEENKKGA